MLGYLSLDIICSSKLTDFLELRSRKTVRFSEQIMSADKYPSIFSRQTKAIVYISIICEYIIDPHNKQLPVGPIAQLFEHFTGFAEVQVWVLFRPNVFAPCPLLPSVKKSADYTSKYYYYLILRFWFMSSAYSSFRLVRLEKIVSGSWDILFA